MNGVVGRKTVLAIVSVLSLLSMGGGFLLLPLLVPFHVWAARRSGPVGRVLWSAIPVAATGMVAWATVYSLVGETKPWIWLIPATTAVVAVSGMIQMTAVDRRRPSGPER